MKNSLPNLAMTAVITWSMLVLPLMAQAADSSAASANKDATQHAITTNATHVNLDIKMGQAQPEVLLKGWTQISGMYLPLGKAENKEGGVIRFPLPPEDYYVMIYVPFDPKGRFDGKVYFNEHELAVEPQQKNEVVRGQGWSRFHGRISAAMFVAARSQTLRIVGEAPIFEVDFRGNLPPGLPRGGQMQRLGWNIRAQQFMFAPTFWVAPVQGAQAYALTLQNRTGRICRSATRFRTESICTVRETKGAPHRYERIQAQAVAIDVAEIWDQLPAAEGYVAWIDALGAEGKPLDQTRVFAFHKPEMFQGVVFETGCDYLQSVRRNFRPLITECRLDAQNGRPPLSGYRMTIQFPTRVYTQIIDAFLAYAELAAENEQEKQEAISYARDFGQQLLAIQIKEGPYRGLTQSHTESWGSKNMLQPDRGGMAGTSLLKLYAVTKEARFLNAAVEIAEAFKSTQLPDGRWVYRVNAKTGMVTDDYTSDHTEQILFLDRLVNEHGRQDFAACRDKAVQWMLENPAKTMLWPNSYEDTGTLKGPYANQQHWDTEYFIRYLMRHATPANGYKEIAEKLCRYVEGQFVIWETSGLPMWMGPGAKEKYSFPKLDVCGPLLRMYQDMHEGTGNPLYLEKAKLIANALTRYQLPNGFYPTFPVYGPGPDGTFAVSSQANADSGQRIEWHGIWPNNVAYTGQWLLEFAHYLKKVR
jgi:hypothetical protein